MKLIFDVGFWVDMRDEDGYLKFEPSDGNGNLIELRFDKDGFFSSRHMKKFIKDLESLKEEKKNNERK